MPQARWVDLLSIVFGRDALSWFMYGWIILAVGWAQVWLNFFGKTVSLLSTASIAGTPSTEGRDGCSLLARMNDDLPEHPINGSMIETN